MPGFEGKKKEQAKERGKNVTIHALFVRHGEKEASTKTAEATLTDQGREMAVERGRILDEHDIVKAYSSKTDRTEETAKLIAENSPTNKKMEQRISGELGLVCSEDGKFYKDVMKMKAEVLGEDFNDVDKKEQEARLKERLLELETKQTNYYLSFGDKRPDPTTYSPVETAAMMARRVSKFIRMPEKLHSGSDVELINASHDLNIAAFLSQVLVHEDVEGGKAIGFDDVEVIGGPIEYVNGFELLISTDEKGEKSVKFLFNGIGHDIDMERLEELNQMALKMKREELEVEEEDG